MAGPKPVRPLSSKGSLEKSSDVKKTKKAVAKKPNNDPTESPKKPNSKPVELVVKESVVVKLQPTQIEEAVKAFSKLVELNSAEAAEKSLFASEGQKVSLQISGVKLARDSENQVIKIKLPHSPLPPNKDVCLFVKDLEKGLKVDHEDTVNHFTSLLADKGVTGVTKVISLRELKVEYKQYEAKTQLCHRFEHFLADDRIIRLLPQFLGKPFYKRKKLPVQVNLLAKDLPAEFAKCLNTTVLPLKNTGSCSMVVVGMSTHTATQLVENTKTVVSKLEEKYPGGWINIRSIHLNSGSTSLPLYVSFRSTAEVGLVRGGKKPNRSVVMDELSTVVGGTVVITPHGNVKVKRKADPEWTEDDDTLKELIRDERGYSKVGQEDDKDKENNKSKDTEAAAENEKKPEKKSKKQKKKSEEEESEDEMEDQEMEYMKKVAEEEEQIEKQIEETESSLSKKLKADEEASEDSEEEVDDDAEAENLLSEGDSSDSDGELIMKKGAEDDEEEETPIKKKKSKKSKSPKDKSASKKSKKQQKFVEKKKEKVKGGKK